MVRISVLNDCLRSIVNAERKGKRQVLVKPSSKVVIKVWGACVVCFGVKTSRARGCPRLRFGTKLILLR
jgi:small subunit ribosomal protein S15Ae